MSRNLFWSFVYQYSQTLNSVGSIVAKVLENLDRFGLVNPVKFLGGEMAGTLLPSASCTFPYCIRS
jgi:hypothetical protein